MTPLLGLGMFLEKIIKFETAEHNLVKGRGGKEKSLYLIVKLYPESLLR